MESHDTFIACYDLAISPTSFDVLGFILNAISSTKDGNYKNLKIVISPGPSDGFRLDGCRPESSDIRRQMLHGIVIPACRMATDQVEILRTPLEDTSIWGVGRRKYGMDVLVEQLKRGNRSLKPNKSLPKNNKLITITLREAEHHKHRNSNVPEWLEASNKLCDMGYRVVFIRDTNKAKEALDATTIMGACYDLDLRAAFYKSAYCNLFVNNGPAYLCAAIDAPAIIYRLVNPNQWNESENFWKYYGMDRNSQLPGWPPHQRTVKEEDSADIIISEFLKWRECQI